MPLQKSAHSGFNEFNSFMLSLGIHILFLALMASISFIQHHISKKKTLAQATRDIEIESIAVSQDNEALQAGSESGTGPFGLNDSAGRELLETARSGISVTPDNFMEYDKIRNLRRGMGARPRREDIYEKYPFLKGSAGFDTGLGRKSKSDFQECYEDACRIINYSRADRDDEAEKFAGAVMDYLNGKRAVRTWRTLWMVPKPATMQEKIELVRLLRRLHLYSLEGENAGYGYLRGSLKALVETIPDELKFPGIRNR